MTSAKMLVVAEAFEKSSCTAEALRYAIPFEPCHRAREAGIRIASVTYDLVGLARCGRGRDGKRGRARSRFRQQHNRHQEWCALSSPTCHRVPHARLPNDLAFSGERQTVAASVARPRGGAGAARAVAAHAYRRAAAQASGRCNGLFGSVSDSWLLRKQLASFA